MVIVTATSLLDSSVEIVISSIVKVGKLPFISYFPSYNTFENSMDPWSLSEIFYSKLTAYHKKKIYNLQIYNYSTFLIIVFLSSHVSYLPSLLMFRLSTAEEEWTVPLMSTSKVSAMKLLLFTTSEGRFSFSVTVTSSLE